MSLIDNSLASGSGVVGSSMIGSQMFPEVSALLFDSFSAGGSGMGMITTGGIGSDVTGASEVTILFSSGPGSASLALHRIVFGYDIISSNVFAYYNIRHPRMSSIANRLLTG